MAYDAIVLGGGIIGALSAFELGKQGAKVVLIEKNIVGAGASGSSAAMIEFQLDAYRGEPFLSLARASRDLFPSLHQELLKLTQIDFQYDPCGILQLALNKDDDAWLQKEVARQKSVGMKIQWFTPEQLESEIPQLEPTGFGGALYQEDGQVNGERFLSAAVEAARRFGAEIIEGEGKDVRLVVESHRVTGVQAGNKIFKAAKIILATGAWTDELLGPLDIKLGIEPIRGQLLVYDTPTSRLPYPIYTRTGGYLTPKKDGFTLAGTTVERAGFDNSNTESGKKSIAERASSLVPAFGRTSIRGASAGLRPKSPNELPILGPLDGHPNVIIAAGHYRNGILLAPITAQLVAALILEKPLAISIEPFLPKSVISKTQSS